MGAARGTKGGLIWHVPVVDGLDFIWYVPVIWLAIDKLVYNGKTLEASKVNKQIEDRRCSTPILYYYCG